MQGKIEPWFTKGALEYIEKIDYKGKSIWEYGTGYSTLWFSQRCKSIVTVDNDKDWKSEMQILCGGLNVEFLLKDLIKCQDCEYVQAINRDNKIYDIIIIDGRNRVLCAFEAVKHIKSGSMVIFDNSNREEYNPGLSVLTSLSSEVLSWDHPEGRLWRTSIFIIK